MIMPRNIVDKGDIDISEEQAEAIARMQDEAVRDSDPESGSQTIAMRWGRPQLRAVKRAAALRGMPYQLYIRNAAWEAARNDLERAQVVAH